MGGCFRHRLATRCGCPAATAHCRPGVYRRSRDRERCISVPIARDSIGDVLSAVLSSLGVVGDAERILQLQEKQVQRVIFYMRPLQGSGCHVLVKDAAVT